MESPSPLRIALIGYGYAGKTFHAPLIRAVPGLELAAVVSRDASKVQADGLDVRVASLAQVLGDDTIDAVAIASPNDTHAPLARAAIEAGKHVVVDKPFALDLAEARALVTLADQHNVLLSVFQNRRWDSDFLGVKQAMAEGVVGDVTHVESHIDRFRPHVRARWREQAGAGGGVWYDLGPHLIDQALCLFGLPDGVSASLAIQRAGGESTDWAHAVLSYGERRVILHASMQVAGGSPRFIVHGSKGSLIKQRPDRQEAQLLDGLHPGAATWGVDDDAMQYCDGSGEVRHLPVPAGDQRRYYAALRDAVRGDSHELVSATQAIGVMAVLEAALLSSREGRVVRPACTDDERQAWASRRW